MRTFDVIPLYRSPSAMIDRVREVPQPRKIEITATSGKLSALPQKEAESVTVILERQAV